MFYIVLYIYIAAIAISFLVSLKSFRYHYPKHLKLFSLLLGSTLLVETTANFFLRILHINKYRSGLYTIFSLIEFVVYAYFFYLITETKWVKKMLGLFIFLFPPVWIGVVFLSYGFNDWNSTAMAIIGFFTVCFALLYIYHLSLSEQLTDLSRNSEFWIAIGLIIFYSCEIPYLGTLHYLNQKYLGLSRMLLNVSLIINSIMYFLFTYAFLCRRKKY